MRWWLAKPFVWAWWAVGLRWLPGPVRLVALLVLLYVGTVAVLRSELQPRPRLVVRLTSPVVPLGFSADGRTVAAFEDLSDIAAPIKGAEHLPVLKGSRRLGLWDVATGQPLAQFQLPCRVDLTEDVAKFCRLSSDGLTLFMRRYEDGRDWIDAWDLRAGRARQTFRAQGEPSRHPQPTTFALCRDGRRVGILVVDDADRQARGPAATGRVDVWDTATGELITTVNHPGIGHAAAFTFGPNSRRLAVDVGIHDEAALARSGVLIYDLDRRRPVTTLVPAYHGAFSTDGAQYLALAPGGGSLLRVIVHDLVGGRPPQLLFEAPGAAHRGDGLSFWPARGLIVSGGAAWRGRWPAWLTKAVGWFGAGEGLRSGVYETVVRLTAVPTGSQDVLRLPEGTRFACDGASLVTCTGGGRLEFWDLPLRPPWPLILGYAAVPPGLVLAAGGVRRAWRRKKLVPITA